MDKKLEEILERYIGQTVTIFTTSGGLSGSGFTGVLLSVDCDVVRLLADIGEPPACVFENSPCRDCKLELCENEFCGNPLGAVCVIPINRIACFTHNTIG